MQIESFLKYIRYELNLSACTVLSYKNDLGLLESYLSHGESEVEWTSVTENDIREWMISRSEAGDSSRTIRRRIQAVRALYKYMMKRGIVGDNPASEIELAKVSKRLPVYVRESSMDSVLSEPWDEDDFESVRDRLILLMLYSTGIRRAELVDLKDVNVDASAGEMKVHGKRNKERVVPFGDELSEAIKRYRELKAKAVGPARTESFFVRKNGAPLYPQLVYKVVHERLSAVGAATKCSPHVLRHTFASAMLNHGAKLNSVKEILGHESLATTQVYTHITFSELKSNYELAHPRALKKGG